MFTTCRYDTNFSINLYTFGKHIHVYWKKFIINKKNKTTKMFCKQKLHAKLAKLRSWNIKRKRKWLMNIWSERPKGGYLIIACGYFTVWKKQKFTLPSEIFRELNLQYQNYERVDFTKFSLKLTKIKLRNFHTVYHLLIVCLPYEMPKNYTQQITSFLSFDGKVFTFFQIVIDLVMNQR